MRSHELSQFAVMPIAMAAVVVPIVIGGAGWEAVALGAVAWIGGYVVKLPLAGAAYLAIPQERTALHAAAAGLLSSVSELGVAAVLFTTWGGGYSNADILAFTAAAAATEALLLVGASYVQKTPDQQVAEWLRGAECSRCVRHVFFIERMVALSGHIGSRGLVCVALLSGRIELAVIAIACFALTDCVADYGRAKQWNWFDPRICRQFYGGSALISAAEIALYAIAS